MHHGFAERSHLNFIGDITMAFFIIRMSHTDERGWSEHLEAHLDYLHTLVREGIVRASGKVVTRRLARERRA